MSEVDVLVVGAGPAGSTVAERLSRVGHDVLVIEEHAKVGHPVQCAGLVSQRVLDLAASPRIVRRPVRGATVVSPGLQALTFRAPEPRAFVIDRAGLDVALADRAARSGARYEVGTRFASRGATVDGRSTVRAVNERGEDREIRARLVVGADGVASPVARAFRLRRPVEILPAFEAEFPQATIDPEEVEVYLGTQLAPGLFGWSIPDGGEGARIGIAAHADGTMARRYFERLLDQIARRSGTRPKNPTQYIVSGIPIGLVPATHAAGVLLVGDAAAQVKPLSGGGIFTGMRCAEIAAQVAHDALVRGDLSAAALSSYDVRWRQEFGDEFQRALYLRRLFLKLGDADLEAIVEALRTVELRTTIVAFGDIDFPSHVARQVLRQSPSLLRLFPKAVSALWSGGSFRAPDLDLGTTPTA